MPRKDSASPFGGTARASVPSVRGWTYDANGDTVCPIPLPEFQPGAPNPDARREIQRVLRRIKKNREGYLANREKRLAASRAAQAKQRAAKTHHWCIIPNTKGRAGTAKGDAWREIERQKHKAELASVGIW